MFNYIFWHCALDEDFSPEESGLFVWKTFYGNISSYRECIKKIRKDRFEDSDGPWWWSGVGEVGWRCCTVLEKGQYLVAMYNDFGDDGQAVLSFDSESKITLDQVKDYLSKHSYDNDECRGRPCRNGNAFYSFIVDWQGNVVYRPPTIEYPELELCEESNERLIEWKSCDVLDLDFGGYSERYAEVAISRECFNIPRDKTISKYEIGMTLLCLRKYDFRCLPVDVFKIIYYMVLDFNQKYFELPYHDPILPSFKLSWENAKIGDKKTFYWENPAGDREKMRLDVWMAEKDNIYSKTQTLKYLYCDLTVVPAEPKESSKFLVMSISGAFQKDLFNRISFDKSNFVENKSRDTPSKTSFKTCVYSSIENKDLSICFYVYYNY